MLNRECQQRLWKKLLTFSPEKLFYLAMHSPNIQARMWSGHILESLGKITIVRMGDGGGWI
jgi:hypothetical protein